MRNNLRKLRTAKGLTQAQLAKLAGLAQQQVQRAESGVHAVRIEVAAAIAAALGAALGEVFPEISKHAPAMARRRNLNALQIKGDKTRTALEHAGMDVSPEYWITKVRLPGGRDRMYPITSIDARRLEGVLTNARPGVFFCFNSQDHIVCLRLAAAHYIEILWENARIGKAQELAAAQSSNEDSCKLRMYFADSSEPEVFDVEQDEPEEEDGEDLDRRPLTALAMELESWDHGEAWPYFIDDDGGEYVHFNPENLAAIEIPIAASRDDDEVS